MRVSNASWGLATILSELGHSTRTLDLTLICEKHHRPRIPGRTSTAFHPVRSMDRGRSSHSGGNSELSSPSMRTEQEGMEGRTRCQKAGCGMNCGEEVLL